MTGSLAVRPARQDDIPDIIRLWRELTEFHAERDAFFTLSADGPENFRKFLLERIGNEKACIAVAEADGKVVAYCVVVIENYPPVLTMRQYCEIFDFAVTARYRRRGIGQAMFQYVKNWVSEKGIKRIEARVAITNKVSMKFWRKMGLAPYLEVMYCEV